MELMWLNVPTGTFYSNYYDKEQNPFLRENSFTRLNSSSSLRFITWKKVYELQYFAKFLYGQITKVSNAIAEKFAICLFDTGCLAGGSFCVIPSYSFA